MMFKSCEEYVLDRVNTLENKLREASDTVSDLTISVDYYKRQVEDYESKLEIVKQLLTNNEYDRLKKFLDDSSEEFQF